MQNFSIENRLDGQWAILTVAGDVDLSTAAKLREELLKQIEAGHPFVAVDVKDVGFLDSTGLSALVAGLKRTRERQGRLVLVSPSPQVRRILTITDLTKILPVYETLDAAMASGGGLAGRKASD